jgi:cytidylate kinase
MVVAIDGTTASGKGTVARMLAGRLNISYLDTGAIYRAITVFFIAEGFNPNAFDAGVFAGKLEGADIQLKCDESKRISVFLDGEDITERIRDNRVSAAVPVLAQLQFVQDKVHQIQHDYAKDTSLVVEGRETTSVAFPDADYKFYFDVDIDVRANRRLRDLRNKGDDISLEEVRAQIERRDYLDFTRDISPLIKVPGAIEIDAGKTPDEVVDEMMSYIVK